MSNREPTHSLCMKPIHAPGEKWATIGVGWKKTNVTGTSISITLNRGVVLNWRDCDDMKIELFERNR